MKYIKILLPVLVSGVIFFACSKDDGKVDTPGDKVLDTYYPGAAMEIKELSLYTKNGVVTDKEVIHSYIDRNLTDDMKSRFYFNTRSVAVPQSNTILKFLDNSRVNINNTNMEITTYKDSLMLISEYPTSQVPLYGISTCSELFAKIPAITPLYGCIDSTCATYRKTTPIISNGNSAYAVPLLTYVVTTNNCTFASAEWPMINVLSNDFETRLAIGDTVLVQYATLPLVKKVTN